MTVARLVCEAAALAAVAIATGLVLRTIALPPAVVWSLRGPGSPGHASLTVHDRPAGDAVPGRWILVESEEAGAGVVLVRLPLQPRDRAGLLARVVARSELTYTPTGATAREPGAVWYAWRRN